MMGYHMVKKLRSYVEPCGHSPRVWQTDRRTDERMDGRTDGRRTDRITITKTVQRIASHGKNTCPWVHRAVKTTTRPDPNASRKWSIMSIFQVDSQACNAHLQNSASELKVILRSFGQTNTYPLLRYLYRIDILILLSLSYRCCVEIEILISKLH